MARTTRSKKNSAIEVIDILNQSKRPQAENSGKRKKKTQASHRPVPRPSKRAKAASDAEVVEEAYITPAATGTEEKGFDLRNSAFDPVSSSKEEAADLAKSPSQNTRSKLVKADLSRQQASLKGRKAPARVMRNLLSKPAFSNSVGDDSLADPGDRRQPLQTSKTRTERLLRSDHSGHEAAIMSSDKHGYPSPEMASSKRKSCVKGASRPTVALGTNPFTLNAIDRRPANNDTDHQPLENGGRR